MPLSFTQQLNAEQLRAIEDIQGVEPVPAVASVGLDFPTWLVRRNAELSKREPLRQMLQHAPGIFFRLFLAAVLLAILAGVVTSIKALGSAGTQLNIFWVLGVLLGLSWLSLLLWLATLLLNRDNAGVLAPLFRKLLDRILPARREPSAQQAADRVWLQRLLFSSSGYLRLGWITHGIWSAYLLGGLLGLLLLFATRQFDFVWESTLLGGDSFVAITGALTPPLAAIGVPVPDAGQILTSSLDQTPVNAAQTRRVWAIFLLGCVLIYGLLPRLLMGLICVLAERRAQSRQTLDLNQPYYIRLQREFWPQSSRPRVLDADDQPAAPLPTGGKAGQLPANCQWFGLELPAQFSLPAATPPDFINLRDEASRRNALAAIKAQRGAVALLVDGNKAADRGLQRVVMELAEVAGARNLWLVLRPQAAEAKHQSWLQAAARAGLTPEQVTFL
ncbi:MAG: DUF2868 domain-containing protein [Cellvibrionaceae bacterium]|nr:DUF2868 domain-containing protein [Cellvibrionaceae bacterium]